MTVDKAKASRLARVPLIGPMLAGHWAWRVVAVLLAAAIVAGAALLAWDGYERVKFGRERIDQVDLALQRDRPDKPASFCRRQFGDTLEYETCVAQDRSGYRAFARAWPRARQLGTWREQMITCLQAARREAGVSWAIASRCSESDAPGPDARN